MPLPIAENAADRLRFLWPSRLSPWLSAHRLSACPLGCARKHLFLEGQARLSIARRPARMNNTDAHLFV